jgi:hypothetical protein
VIRRFLLAGMLLVCCAGVASAQKVIVFAHGKAEVLLPASYVATELNDGTLRAIFGPAADHRLEFALVEAASVAGDGKAGEQYVRVESAKRNAKLFGLPGKVVFMEPAGDVLVDGRNYRVARWLVGAGNAVVLMTLTAPAEMTPDLRQFLDRRLEGVLTSVRVRQ